MDLQHTFGNIDIYLFDQLLRGRIRPGMRFFDAGCGAGRNLVFLLREGYEVFGADADPNAVAATQRLARELAPSLPVDNFRHEPMERLSFPLASMDVVVASAVLHFAKDDTQFAAMLEGAWRVLKPGGMFFARLASTIGIESLVHRRGERRFLLPDGSERYLVDEALLMEWTARLGARLLDPIKTTVVQGQRSMTTWILECPSARVP